MDPPNSKTNYKKKTAQPHDQDIWSNFSFVLENINNHVFAPKPSLGTILNHSGIGFCSSHVVSNLTLTYSEAHSVVFRRRPNLVGRPNCEVVSDLTGEVQRSIERSLDMPLVVVGSYVFVCMLVLVHISL